MAKDLTIGYRGHEVAHGVSFAVSGGQLACLIGPNGAGKSTLLKVIAGFLRPISGRLSLQGRDATMITSGERARLLSIVLTQRPDVQNITTEELVGLGRTPYTNFWGTLSAADREVVSRSMELVGISSLKQRMVSTLSDGECQKVLAAKALAQETPVILLDEPTAFLDYPSKVGLMRLLRSLATDLDKTIIVSTHDLELALRFSDTLYYIADGGLREMSKPELADYLTHVINASDEGA